MINLIDTVVPDLPGSDAHDTTRVNTERNLLKLSSYVDLTELITDIKNISSHSSKFESKYTEPAW